jgi:tetratricopeptide (TPR) repeat protein
MKHGRPAEAKKAVEYASGGEEGKTAPLPEPFVVYGRSPARPPGPVDDPEWARKRAGLLWRAGRNDAALSIFVQLFQSDQSDLRSCAGIGRCLFSLGRYSDAEWYLAKALEAYPKEPAIMGMRAWCLAVRGEHSDALDLFNKALDIDKTNQQLWRDGAQLLVMMKKPKVALLLLERAVENDPSDVEVRVRKAAVLIDLKKYDEAVSACDQALKVDPRSSFAWSIKAQALRAQKRVPEADWCQEQARKLSGG